MNAIVIEESQRGRTPTKGMNGDARGCIGTFAGRHGEKGTEERDTPERREGDEV